ncbi:hypothetical protein [Falsochrobactrum shanghaiense]|uniref:hypothetical protein n=1 Tax=Falsochrobactrum shanghaiense TaxID=2201899 RepID=UPI001304D6A0|nr:hypothetical protein [Falsochrobactrum shanghaiense]
MKKTAWLAFCFLGLVCGSNFIFVKWAAEYITPAQITLLRVVFGFLPVFLFALLRGELRWSRARHHQRSMPMSAAPHPLRREMTNEDLLRSSHPSRRFFISPRSMKIIRQAFPAKVRSGFASG